MAGRGSGIGLGAVGGYGTGNVGGSATSLRTGQLYGSKAKASMTSMGVHHWLWILVALEVGILLFARAFVFKRYHAG